MWMCSDKILLTQTGRGPGLACGLQFTTFVPVCEIAYKSLKLNSITDSMEWFIELQKFRVQK